MSQRLASIAVLVHDYDAAIAWYTGALGFALLEDTALGDGKRWVRVAPPGETGCSLLLARAADPVQAARVGDQAGSRVGFFLHTDDFASTHARFKERGVEFVENPRSESYGTVAVFLDLYGNKWDLVEPSQMKLFSSD